MLAVIVTAVVVVAATLLVAVKVIKHNEALAARVDAIETKVASTVATDAKKL